MFSTFFCIFQYFTVFICFFHYSADNEERLSLLTTSDDAFFCILLFFVGIFQYFSEFSVLFSISRYFSVFSVLFSIFRVFQYFRYFLVIFSIRQIKRISCHFQQPVMMLRKTFSKKKEEDYCIVKLLHEYPIAFFLFFKFQKQEVSNVRLLSTLPPLSVT